MRKFFVAAFLFSSPAFAVDLTVDQTAKIFMPDGVTVKKLCLENSEDGKSCARLEEMTVGNTIQSILAMPIPNDPDSARAGALAISLFGKDHPVIKHEDQLLILKRADKVSDPVMVARLHEILDPQPDASKTVN